MHIITVSVTVSLIKISFLMILNKGLLTESERKKDSQIGNIIFLLGGGGWGVGPALGG